MTGPGGNVCLNIRVDLKIFHAEDEDDGEATPKELLDLLDRKERRSHPNIASPLEVSLETESERNVVFGANLDGKSVDCITQ